MVKSEDVRVKEEINEEEIGGLVIPKRASDGVFKVPAPKVSSLGMMYYSASLNLAVYSLH